MGNQVTTDLEVMRSIAGKLASDYQDLQQSITTLQGQADAHAATWSGEAKNAWSVAMSEVNNAWSRLNSVLDEITSNINTSGTQYSETDTTNASGFKQVQGGDITAILNQG